MKAFTSALSLTFLLASLAAATPIAAPQNVEVAAATNGTASTCQCEAVICIQSWPESCYCQNDAKIDCFKKCGGEYPTLGNAVWSSFSTSIGIKPGGSL
ncbi:hypothetical protein BKA81DRAFT_404041 [Phyllosticta paracitricarpa]|uniref:Uncharacterized protein n=1 Tax=Phyllosticta paracitricarpa TaxID=2016321 RepID=A0ABR1N8B5_9PEZI